MHNSQLTEEVCGISVGGTGVAQLPEVGDHVVGGAVVHHLAPTHERHLVDNGAGIMYTLISFEYLF